MPYRYNLHTHTTYCDGKNTPEELVQAAIRKGFSVLGFSGHAYTPFDTRYCMSLEGTERYKECIFELKEKYKNDITVLCGLEYDYYSECDTDEFDFLIGSVHYVKINGEYFSIDSSLDHFLKALAAVDNDIYRLIELYYRTISQTKNVDIIGHFDYMTKYNQGDVYFCETDARYLDIVEQAVDTLVKTTPIFEINTGAIARGLRDKPYPAKPVADMIIERGGKLVLSSDCHKAELLDCGFDRALSLYDQATIMGSDCVVEQVCGNRRRQ